MTKTTVNILGKEVTRKIFYKGGIEHIRFNGEEFTLHPRENKVEYPVTSNTVSYLWDLEGYVNSRMYHMNVLKPVEQSLVNIKLHQLVEGYEKHSSFLEEFYPVDHEHLADHINYIKSVLGGNNQ